MKRILAIALLTLLALAFSSCTKDHLGDAMPGGNGIEVRVSFPKSVVSRVTTSGTDAGTLAENRLDRVAILIFNAEGTELETALSVDVTASNTSLSTLHPKWASDQTLLVTPISNPATPKKIYAIANWSKTLFDKDTYTEAMLVEELSTITAVADINGAKAYPILMCGSKAVSDLVSLSYSVTVDMERQVSKIRAQLTISKDIQDKQSQIEWQLDQMKITVFNVPDKSYVVGRSVSPSGATLLGSAAIAVDDTKPVADDQKVPAIKDLVWSESVYSYENPVVGAKRMDKAKSIYIVVQLPYKNRISGATSTDNCYKIHINDTRDAVSPHKVLRNVIYNLNIRILGRGVPFDDLINDLTPDVNIDDELTVVKWEDGENVDADFTYNTFNIDRTHLEFQSMDNDMSSVILTNVMDWKLVKQDGSTIFSFAENYITSVTIDNIRYNLSGTASAATITATKTGGTEVFAPQKMFLIAKNLKMPFTISHDNGFISNAILKAAGWPEHRLPVEGGLQIAKRGNILPGGIAVDEDPKMQLKTESTPTAGVESINDISQAVLGAGKGGTDAMTIPSQINLHPAAKYCRALGPEWYLPSIAELKLIYNNAVDLGPSYTFITNLYRSASESGNSGWLAYLSNGNTTAYSKTAEGIRVRCVRGTPPSIPDVGFIPNAALQAAGWPAERLPLEGGLQLAMRGNVLPGGIAANKDPQIHWSTESVVTGITAKGYGTGKGNYAQLNALDPDKYPIGQACQALGAGWYVPSQEEMEAVKKNLSILGPSYVFPDYGYWTSTEGRYDRCWSTVLHPDYVSGYTGKTNNIFARCVKGTTPHIPENGFIPNAVLLAGGWPEDRLPTEGGLQLAMRGNVLPGGTAATDDPAIKWSTVNEIARVPATGFGTGKISYDRLKGKDATKYPIGQACKHLGPDWYVPSPEELKLISNHLSMLTPSYSLIADSYWASAEKDANNGWYVRLDNYSIEYSAKLNPYLSYRTRCVKGTPPPLPDFGYIPNRVLLAGGWPADRLPTDGGLQVAKRGNILPEGIAADDDQQIKWDKDWTADLVRTHVRGTGFGDGKENYARLDVFGRTVGQVCKHLGPEWYVPSRDELKLIYNNRSMMGASYSFFENPFWSDSEYYSLVSRAWYVNFSNGNTEHIEKINDYFVRCVKGTPPPIPDFGFIPNSVLQAGGWPVDRLPAEGGLQLAKRGNVPLDSFSAYYEDDVLWTEGPLAVTGITASGLGDGKENYYNLGVIDPVGSPISQICKALGPEWYVPSVEEMQLISKNNSMFGPSFNLNGYSYWTITESNRTNARYVGLDSGGQAFDSYKVSKSSVRCVKGTPPLRDFGFIPNSVLQAGGWPADRLPKEGGLQIAKRGNILPGGTAAGSDPYVKWSTVNEIVGITAFGLGDGKGAYDILKAKNASNYPIGQACQHLGSDWYVPSVDELTLIYNNRPMLGPSYMFSANPLWSSSEDSSNSSGGDAWYAKFTDGRRLPFSKSGDYLVRCVKGTPPPRLDTGFIPNSVLQAGGWPADKLPKEGGLQIAKRGNVLPEGTATADALKAWSGELKDVRVTATGFGYGKSNYDLLKTHDAFFYPIGQACLSLGPDWYVPSRNELQLIYNNHSMMGPSYTFPGDARFWSSSEYDGVDAWGVNFVNGSMDEIDKREGGYARCVKGTPPPPPIPPASYITRERLQVEGWPTSRLPKIGLQVAMIGNVLPGGTPGYDQENMRWSTVEEFTGISAAGLGAGKGNYARLNAKDATTYPIGQACKHLGPEWYVPSKDELELVYVYNRTQGPSYRLAEKTYYLSSSEDSGNNKNVWCLNLPRSERKVLNSWVRCVREI